jgi:hypothetical protein
MELAVGTASSLLLLRYGEGVGILLGWIIQKRWLTPIAFGLFVGAVFALSGFSAPVKYLSLGAAVLLFMAVIYEGSDRLGLKIGKRLRLAWAAWMAFSMAVLLAGAILGGSNQTMLVVSLAAFLLLVTPSLIFLRVVHTRGLREERVADPLPGRGKPS